MSAPLKIGLCPYVAPRPVKGRQPTPTAKHVAAALDDVARAATEGADLVLLPEIFALQDRPDWWAAAEPLDGPVIEALGTASRRLKIWIAAGHVTLEKGKRFNSLVLFDRRGRLATVYHKSHPTIWELQNGITPGNGAQVLETEFGRLGFAICYDLNFAELRAQYRDLRPALILFSSFFPGGLQAQWWAFESRAYLASSVINPGGALVNPLGRVLARTSARRRVVTTAVNLDYAVVHLDYTNRNLDAIRRREAARFAFDEARPEGVLLITSLGRRSAADLVRASGWETAEEYFARARVQRRRAIKGMHIPPGPPPWVSSDDAKHDA